MPRLRTREALVRLRPEADVAEANEAIDVLALAVGEHGLECEQVSADAEMKPTRMFSRSEPARERPRPAAAQRPAPARAAHATTTP